MIELIGTNAGLVWNVLNEGGKMSFKAVKKATKIKAEKDMYAAFGWLAKEGKLAFEDVAQVLAYAKDTKEKFPHYHVRSYIVYICANKGWKCWEVTP